MVIQPFLDLVQWLIWVSELLLVLSLMTSHLQSHLQEKEMTVFVECSVLADVHLKNNPLFVPIKGKVRTFNDGRDLTGKVDFIVCLGGDGTLLYASSLFQVEFLSAYCYCSDRCHLSGKRSPGDGLPHGFPWLPHPVRV